jgi:hypothetical protein
MLAGKTAAFICHFTALLFYHKKDNGSHERVMSGATLIAKEDQYLVRSTIPDPF